MESSRFGFAFVLFTDMSNCPGTRDIRSTRRNNVSCGDVCARRKPRRSLALTFLISAEVLLLVACSQTVFAESRLPGLKGGAKLHGRILDTARQDKDSGLPSPLRLEDGERQDTANEWKLRYDALLDDMLQAKAQISSTKNVAMQRDALAEKVRTLQERISVTQARGPRRGVNDNEEGWEEMGKCESETEQSLPRLRVGTVELEAELSPIQADSSAESDVSDSDALQTSQSSEAAPSHPTQCTQAVVGPSWEEPLSGAQFCQDPQDCGIFHKTQMLTATAYSEVTDLKSELEVQQALICDLSSRLENSGLREASLLKAQDVLQRQVAELQGAMKEVRINEQEKQQKVLHLEQELALAHSEIAWEKRLRNGIQRFDADDFVRSGGHRQRGVSRSQEGGGRAASRAINDTDSNLKALLSQANTYINKVRSREFQAARCTHTETQRHHIVTCTDKLSTASDVSDSGSDRRSWNGSSDVCLDRSPDLPSASDVRGGLNARPSLVSCDKSSSPLREGKSAPSSAPLRCLTRPGPVTRALRKTVGRIKISDGFVSLGTTR